MILHGVKTYYSAIDAAADLVAGQSLSPDERTVIFCEDKLTLSMEKAIVERLGGTFNVEVLTFGRYIKKNGNGQQRAHKRKRGYRCEKNSRFDERRTENPFAARFFARVRV